ncbi:MAG TPA: cobalamin-binding protein [Burkholderiales bacterium]|jgi:iron complex transport system substrate-binding protein|nr:cobalamin-binding protein [Burkholderiales bacterium]
MRFLTLAWLGAAASAFAGVSAVDSDGRRLELAQPAARIVSLAPHVTEQLFAAGAGARLVAVSEYSDYPEEAKRLPQVASSGGVDLERVLALKPDLVVAWRLEATAAALARLEALGVPVFYSEPRRLAQIPDSIEALGELAGTADTAHAVAASLREQLNQLKTKYGTRRRVSVFYQISERPLMTLGGRQFVSDAIELCGGHNVFADSPVMAPQVNIEAVLAADPEAIITASARPSERSWQALWRRFPGMRAVRAENLYAVPMNEMHRHGPRAIGATALLCRDIDEARLKAASPR